MPCHVVPIRARLLVHSKYRERTQFFIYPSMLIWFWTYAKGEPFGSPCALIYSVSIVHRHRVQVLRMTAIYWTIPMSLHIERLQRLDLLCVVDVIHRSRAVIPSRVVSIPLWCCSSVNYQQRRCLYALAYRAGAFGGFATAAVIPGGPERYVATTTCWYRYPFDLINKGCIRIPAQETIVGSRCRQ